MVTFTRHKKGEIVTSSNFLRYKMLVKELFADKMIVIPKDLEALFID